MSIDTFHPGEALPVASSPAVDAITRWAANLSTAAHGMRMIVDTPFFPQSLWPLPKGVQLRDWPTPHLQHPRESHEEYLARREGAIASGSIALVKGVEIGLEPQSALESIYVVRGKPGMYAEAMEAIARDRGHEIVLEELSDRICRMRGRHRKSDAWQRFEFSMERARKAGYTRQNPKYDADPQTMLHSRCRAITVRGTCPEVLKGLRSVEEIEDDDQDRQASRTAVTRTIQRVKPQQADAPRREPPAPTPPPAPPSGPPLPGEDEPPQPPVSRETGPTQRPEAIEPRTWQRINARFVELAVTGDGQTARRLAVISRIVGRPIARGSELTIAEGQLVLDNLAGTAGADIVGDVLGDHAHPAAPAPAGTPTADDDSDDTDIDEHADGDYDPTIDGDWPDGQDPDQ